MKAALTILLLIVCLAAAAQQGNSEQLLSQARDLKDRYMASPGTTTLFDSGVQVALMAIDQTGNHCSDCLLQAYQVLEQLYATHKQYGQALTWKEKYTELNDSLGTNKRQREQAQEAVKFQYSKKALADSVDAANKKLYSRQRLQRQITWSVLGIGSSLLLLAFSFFTIRNNRLLKKEKQRTEDLLHNILPRAVADELKQKGTTTAAHYQEVTVMFAEITGVQERAKKGDPQTMVDVLHESVKAIDAIIQQYGMEKIKTIGDTYLAVAGLPVSVDDHAFRVMQAAVAIRSRMSGETTTGEAPRIRIGIHTGPVVAGVVGVKKFAYDIWGDTVNVAARMQQNSEPGKINISEATWQKVQGHYTTTYRGEIVAKNKGALKMYYVV